MAKKKLTFSLDEVTIERLKALARRTRRPQSWVVREAVVQYQPGRPIFTPEQIAERRRFADEMMALLPRRPRAEIDAELAEIRKSRKSWYQPPRVKRQ